MITEVSLLVRLVMLIDKIPAPSLPGKRPRGKPPTYSEKLLLKALLIMIVRHVYTAHGLLQFLAQDDPTVRALRELLHENGRFPHRRTWERRLAQLPPQLPGQIASFGIHLVTLLKPWQQQGRAVAVDSTMLRTSGGVWHQKDRKNGVIPHSSIDCEAGWSKSGYHGWWYGWKLHLVVTVGSWWIPLAAELTPANVGDNLLTPQLLTPLSAEVRFVLGDTHYNDPVVRTTCEQRGISLVATRRGARPHTDGGVEVRRLFHRLRSQSIEPFNGLFKEFFGWRKCLPVKGLVKSQLFALGAIFLYQLILFYQFERGLQVGKDIKALLKAA